jgi:hypothetical protein
MNRGIFAATRSTPSAVCSCNLASLVDEDNATLVIRLESSSDSAAGAVAAYLLRRLAARAGAYAPGIQENLFYEIAQNANGSNLDKVERWIASNSGKLSVLGYQFLCRRVAAATEDVIGWIEEGKGYRAAILAVDGTRLYGNESTSSSHAVALLINDATAGIADKKVESGLLMADAWPGIARFTRPPRTLDRAHLAYKYGTLLLSWTGHG